MEPSLLQIHLVERGDLQLSPGGRLDLLGHGAHSCGVKIEPDDRIIRLGIGRLLLDGQDLQPFILVVGHFFELHDAESLRILHIVAKDRRLPAARCLHSPGQLGVKSVSVENIVPQDHRTAVVADEVLTDREGLGEPFRLVLDRVFQLHPELGAVSQELADAGRVLRRGDDEHLADLGQHQCAERVIDHRFVVYRKQLFTCYDRQWI